MLGEKLFIDLAFKEAWKFQILTYPNPAVGAVVVERGKVISVEAHQKAGESHAEVKALVSAFKSKSGLNIDFNPNDANSSHNFLLSLPKNFFKDCEIFLTLEPCSHHGKTPSCALLLSKLKLKRVVISTLDPLKEHSGGVKILKSSGIDVKIGVEKSRGEELIEPFKIWQKRAFILFKLAQSLNGKIGGGYLSSKESLTHTHKIREVVDKMVIGGKTVREDRPTLDCRFSNKNIAPDITIFSRRDKSNFDREIPLFKVKNRTVEIKNSLKFDNPSLILVEGGEGVLKALGDKIDWFLNYLTPKLSENMVTYSYSKNLIFLHQERVGKDYILWSKFEQ